jgi:hypothetical protein
VKFLSYHFIFSIVIAAGMGLAGCSSSVTDPQISTGLLGDDYFGETILPDEEDLAPPGLSLLNFKGGEFVRSGSDQEIRWILKPESQNDYGLFSSRVEYSDDLGATWKQIPGAFRIPALSGYAVSYIWRIPEISGGDKFILRVTINNSSGEEKSTQSDSTFTLDNDAPVVKDSSLVINNNQPIKKSYFNYSVGFTDITSPIAFICAKNLNKNSQESVIPTETDACWKKVSELNTTAAKVIDLQNVSYVLGFLPGDYVFRIWAKDQAGNISVLRSGLGEAGFDKKEYNYSPAKAIQFQKVLFANTSNPEVPPTTAEQNFTGGAAVVYVQYKTDDVPSAIEFSVSLDGGTTYGSVIPTTTCAPKSGYDFCKQFPYSSSVDFQVRIKATSALGMVSTSVSPPLNGDKFRLIAGNLDLGLGGSASSAGFKPASEASFVIDTKSRAFINDSRKGILLLNPDDGSVSVYLKKDSNVASSGDGGLVSSATTQGIYTMTIDYQDRLLIVENDRIRRIDTNGKIYTLIGGGPESTGMNFFPIRGCMRTNTADLLASPAYGPYQGYSQDPSKFIESGFVLENAFYKVNSSGNLLLKNIDKQNYDRQADPNYKIKKENIFYENEFANLKIDFTAAANCGFAKKPTITPLPNGDFYLEGFHSRELGLGRGNYIKQANRGAGPTWYAYYSAATSSKSAEIRLIPLKGAGSLNYKLSGDTSSGLGTLYLNQTFENVASLANPQITFNYQTNKLLNIHTRGCPHYSSVCKDFYISSNYSPKSGSSVGEGTQFVLENWGWDAMRLITSRRGELYSLNRNKAGLFKYMGSSNKFERILGTGGTGQCEDGTRALECAVDIQDAFIDENDNIYFFDRDRLRVLVKKSSSYKDSIVVTLFGISKSQGDYDPAEPLLGDSLSARFNNIRSVSLHSSDTKLIVHDSGESLVREFSLNPSDPLKFKISRIAGNVYKTVAPSYNGSLISNALATDTNLNFNAGVYSDSVGNIYARAGSKVFSRLNRTAGPNKDYWEVILGSPATTPTKRIYEIGSNACEATATSPAMCETIDRSYEIQGILPVEGTANPFLLFSTWTWYQYDRQGGFKLTRTNVDGGLLVRNLTMANWWAGLNYRYGVDGTVLGGTSAFPRFSSKAQYLDVNGTGYIISYASESWLNETRIRYVSLVRNASNQVTSGGKVGTLIDGLPTLVRSHHFIYNAASTPNFTGYICLASGELYKYTFDNAMTSHTGSGIAATSVSNVKIKLPNGYQCAGVSMEYSDSEKKLYFPVSYDGLMGVGEIKL